MTDRELLVLAAKAAGLDVGWKMNECSGSEMAYIHPGSYMPQHWNPLTDDGDALRLAVKLQLWLRYRDDNSVNACWYDAKGFFGGNVTEEIGSLRNGDEPNAATRRAIVRAAATIGKSA